MATVPAVATAGTHLAHFFSESQLLSLAQISLSHIERTIAHSSKQGSGEENRKRQQASPEDADDSWEASLAMCLTDALLSVSSAVGLPGNQHTPQSQERQAHFRKHDLTGTTSNPSSASGKGLLGLESSASDMNQMQTVAREAMSNKQGVAGLESVSDMDQMHNSAQQGDVQTGMWDAVISSLLNTALAGVHTADDLLVKALKMRSNSSITHGFDR